MPRVKKQGQEPQMRVKDLLKALEGVDPEAPVYILDADTSWLLEVDDASEDSGEFTFSSSYY